MKNCNQGRYELLTSRADAIDKLMQLQEICREELSDENRIEFYCSKSGKITITNPPTKSTRGHISAELFAEITEQAGKTYIEYHTSFSNANNILKTISFVLDIIVAVIGLAFAVLSSNKIYLVPVLIFCLISFVFFLRENSNERKNFPEDSEILIKELEKRVEAVNLWDK